MASPTASPEGGFGWFGRRASQQAAAAASSPPPPVQHGVWGALVPEGPAACALFGTRQYLLGPQRTVHVGRLVNSQRALCVPLQQGASRAENPYAKRGFAQSALVLLAPLTRAPARAQ